MSNNQFDAVAINVRERPISDDQNLQAAQDSRTTRMLERFQNAARAGDGSGFFPFSSNYLGVATGFVGDSFKVRAQTAPAMEVVIARGLGFQDDPAGNATDIGGVLGLNDSERYKPLPLEADQTITVPAADPTNPRIDIVEVKYDRRLENILSRDVLNTGTGQFVATSVYKTLAWLLDGRTSVNGSAAINYKTGTPAGSPVAPAVTAGYVKIAEVQVGAAAATITQNKIVDVRKVLAAGGVQTVRLRAAVNGTTAGVGAATTLGLLGPAGSTVIHTAGLVASFIQLYVVCGGFPRNLVVRAWSETGGECVISSPGVGAITALELAVINGATGVIEGQAPAEGQQAVKLGIFINDYLGVPLAPNSIVNVEVSFQS